MNRISLAFCHLWVLLDFQSAATSAQDTELLDSILQCTLHWAP